LEIEMMMNYLSRVRRNHGVEHATLHILSQRYPYTLIAGHSDPQGYWIVGDLPLEAVTQAAQEALQRLRAGQKHLAVHPNCGTNFVTSGIFAGLAAFFALAGAGGSLRQRMERLPMAAGLATMALILVRPLGSLLQERLTTSGDPGALEITLVCTSRRGRMTAHRVITRG
jgi:hypothetical protein